MEAKEKANQLVEKMLVRTYSLEGAKKCALITVQEIYEIDLKPGRHEDEKQPENYYSFWEDVKQEIQKI